MTKEEIAKLEKIRDRYQNNFDFALRNNNKIRQTRYRTLIEDANLKIKELEKEQPLESNERLREVIAELKGDIKKLSEANEELKETLKEQSQRIDGLIHPKKPEPQKDDDSLVCPKCGRTVKGKRGMASHQRWCKKAS